MMAMSGMCDTVVFEQAPIASPLEVFLAEAVYESLWATSSAGPAWNVRELAAINTVQHTDDELVAATRLNAPRPLNMSLLVVTW